MKTYDDQPFDDEDMALILETLPWNRSSCPEFLFDRAITLEPSYRSKTAAGFVRRIAPELTTGDAAREAVRFGDWLYWTHFEQGLARMKGWSQWERWRQWILSDQTIGEIDEKT